MNRLVLQRSVLLLFVSILLVTPALAAECGGGSALCSCGDMVTADHTLTCGVDPVTENSCSGDGLLVAFNVTLNLGNCTLRGSDGGTAVVLGENASVESGRIVGFDFGVRRFPDANPNRIRLLRITDTAETGIQLVGGKLIERNIVERSGRFGILVEANQPIVRQNRIEDSGDCGLVVVDNHALVDRNLVLRGGACGIRITGFRHVVTRNQVKYTRAGPGFLFIRAEENRVILNQSIGAEDPTGAGASPGFLITSISGSNIFERNVASNNAGFGIEDRTDIAVGADTFDRNHCARNTLGASSPAGLC